MATTTISWGDGSGDNLYLTYPSASGDQNVQVSSDANTGPTNRTKTITFSVSHHGTSDMKTLTITQEGVPEEYIVFADSTVEAICAANWGDGVGITPSQAAAVAYYPSQPTLFWGKFTNSGTMTSFNELSYFTNVTTIPNQQFRNNKALTSIGLTNIQLIGNYAFDGCTALSMEVNLPNYVGNKTYYGQFRGSGITKITIGAGHYLANYEFARNCSSLREVHLPATATELGRSQFYNCSNLSVCVCRATTPPTIGTYFFSPTPTIYVPYSADHSILAAYKAASNWSSYQNNMVELNPDGTIPS